MIKPAGFETKMVAASWAPACPSCGMLRGHADWTPGAPVCNECLRLAGKGVEDSPEHVMAEALADEIVYQKDDDGSLRRVLFCAGCGVQFGALFGVSAARKDDDEEALCVRCELARALDGAVA